MEFTQIVIIITLLSVVACFVTITVWLILLLREFRDTIKKTNSILDDTKQVSTSIAQPFNSFSEFITGFKNGVSMFNSFFDKHQHL